MCFASSIDLQGYLTNKGEGAAYILRDMKGTSQLKLAIVEIDQKSQHVVLEVYAKSNKGC